MRLAVAFWNGIDPEQVDRTLERLEGIGVGGIGHTGRLGRPRSARRDRGRRDISGTPALSGGRADAARGPASRFR